MTDKPIAKDSLPRRAGEYYDNPAVEDWGPSLTDPSFLQECDVNVIIARAMRDGFVSHVNKYANAEQYGDFTSALDLQTAMNVTIAARARFDGLPADIRARFSNDPVELLTFLENPENRAEAERLGLLLPAAEPAGASPKRPQGAGVGDAPAGSAPPEPSQAAAK